jgi:cysteine desulfurase
MRKKSELRNRTVRSIYVDYAATTPMDPRVLEAMTPYFAGVYGNASSINTFGLDAREAIDTAREQIASFMNADTNDVIFTGSATEANNFVMKGFAFAHGKTRTHIAISTIEHDCVLNSVKWLETQGYTITYLPVDHLGLVKLDALEQALQQGVNLVSIIHANNEIGTLQSLAEISHLCHQYDALLHTDAAQSFGKIPIDVKKTQIDLLTMNAHKLYGPKGVGALYLRHGIRLDPLLHGGGHEFGFRSSTENVPGIVGFAKAVELREIEMEPERRRLSALREHLIHETLQIPETYLNGHLTQSLPNIANFRFAFIEGEALLLLLNDAGIAASTGSACSSGSQEPSHVLLALGLQPEDIHGSLRISLGKFNTPEDIDYLIETIPPLVERLREMSPLRAS